MGQADYERVVKEMRLADGTVWPLPIVLSINGMLAEQIQEDTEVALVWENQIIAVMAVTEKYIPDKEHEVKNIYNLDTKDLSCHPGIEKILLRHDTLLAGPIWVIDLPKSGEYPHLRLTPLQTRQIFAARGWQTIVGFQTRNPPHRVHEFIQKHALQMVDGLFVHPATHTLSDDITLPNLVESYQILLENYYPQERVLLSIFPAPMRFAGPREAIFHAICRKNYGCTHFIVGRDHAGYGGYYHPEAACNIFKQFRPDELGIEILSYQPFYCEKCEGVVTLKICPHEGDDISGTKLRAVLNQGQFPHSKAMRPEVSAYLIKALSSKS
jgi:sulfate adenylyltransferase